MAGKEQDQKQKSKIRLKATGDEDAKARATAKRLAELEAEVKSEGAGRVTNSDISVKPAALQSETPSLVVDSAVNRQTADTIFSTHGNSKKLALFWGVLIASLILSKIPGAELFFTPLNQFATLVHEFGHAIVCVLTGGHVNGMTIVADGAGHGGLTMSQGGIQFFTIQAGYLGTAVFGSLLVYLSQFHKLSKGILIGIGSIIGFASICFIAPTLFSASMVQAFFSLLWAVAMAAATIYAGLKLKDSNANLVVLFLAIYTAMDSLRAISIVLSAAMFGSTIWSDATVMEQMFVLPAVFWSFLWATLSVVLLGTTVWFTYGLGGIKPKQIKSTSSVITKRKK
ncbi:MAG: M50 family metallopeptidase [Candidatus Melainabacteria bacterium]|nr:M50 family metallopeptidase [Candidatus Melainabacteria bacterium]